MIKIIFIGLGLIVFSSVVYLILNRFPPSKKSLYDRLGGVYNIAAVINYFSDNLIENPIVGKNSQNSELRDWHTNSLDRLPGLKFMRTLWVCSITGGPFKFSATVPGRCPLSLENAHSKFRITPIEFDAVAKELGLALDHFSVPQQEKNEVMNAFASHKIDIVSGFLSSKGENPPTIQCFS